jgi:uncharacterized protein
MERIQKQQIIKDLAKKMVFLVGPRQVGKTWLSKEIAKEFPNSLYLSYDRLEDREMIIGEEWPEKTDLLILDELHKMKDWKAYLKGVYDTKNDHLKILVTGSARLDVFRQSGDSLAGRFFVHHLLPLSLSEIKQVSGELDLDRLINRSGFPEPYLAVSDIEAERWRIQYVDSLIREDVFNFDNIDNYRNIRTLFELLRHKVASPISYNSLARDLGISPVTVKKYVNILESLYIIFVVKPYSKKISRSILKQPKIYFYDNALVKGDDGKRLENFVALSLLKSVTAENDYLAKAKKLNYISTKDNREVDFAISDEEGGIDNLIEVKRADSQLSSNLIYFSNRYKLPGIQLVKELKRERQVDDLRVLRAKDYLRDLYL